MSEDVGIVSERLNIEISTINFWQIYQKYAAERMGMLEQENKLNNVTEILFYFARI